MAFLDLTSVAVDAPSSEVSGKEELERRVQELLNEWVKRRFTGEPFSIRGENGTLENLEFHHAALLFNQSARPDADDLPWIKWVLTDAREGTPALEGGVRRVKTQWVWNVIVSVSSQQDGVNPDLVCREVASQLAYLLRSSDRDALSEKGVFRVRVKRGPTPVASTPRFVRQLVVSMDTWSLYSL